MPGRTPRRSFAGCVAICAASSLIALASAPSAAAVTRTGAGHAPAGISAAAGMMVNAKTRKEWWGREQAVQRPIASLTKVMTALVVIRAGDLRRKLRITQAEVDYVRTYGASNAGLHAGDILTARQLLNAMLLPSGADAAMALAISYGPGTAKFVRKMNALARRLHMTRTHFTNFDGLLDPPDVSTPADLLKLGEAAMRERTFRNVVKRTRYTLRLWPHHHQRYLWQNTNLLLTRYPGVIGIKTGWTPEAGECLLFEAVHRRRVLIGALLDSAATNSGVTFVDAAKLLNWAFGLHVPIPPPEPPPLRPALGIGG